MRNTTDELLLAANCVAISSYESLSPTCPVLAEVLPDNALVPMGVWDFFMTIGGIGARVSYLFPEHWGRNYKKFCSALKESIQTWHRNARGGSAKSGSGPVDALRATVEQGAAAFSQRGWIAFEDMQEFVAVRSAAGLEAAHAIGLWVLWNVHKDAPTSLSDFRHEEIELAVFIGDFLQSRFSDPGYE